MIIKPRKRGRPVGSLGKKKREMIIDTPKSQTYTSLNEETNQVMQMRIEVLERDKKALQLELEDGITKNKGLDSDTLQRRIIISKTEDIKLRKKIEQCKKELSNERQMMAGGDLIPGKLWVENRYDKISDKTEVKKRMIRAQRALHRNSPIVLSSKEKDELMLRKKDLDSELIKRKAGIGDEWDQKRGHNFDKTVKNLTSYLEECAMKEKELRNINILLDPDNPDANSLQYLNKDRA